MASPAPFVRIPSGLIESSYLMDLAATRLIRAVLYKMDLPSLHAGAPVPDVLVSMAHIAPMMASPGSSRTAAAYQGVRRAVDALGRAELVCARRDLRLRWLDRAEYREGRGEAVLRLSEGVRQLAVESDRVVSYEPSQIRGLTPRAIRLLEWIALSDEGGRACLDFVELREALGLEEGYPAAGDFRRFVVAEGVERIRKRLGIELDMKPVRDGRKLLGVEVDTRGLSGCVRVAQASEDESDISGLSQSQSQLQAQSLLQLQEQSQLQASPVAGDRAMPESWSAAPSPEPALEPAGPQAQENRHCDPNESVVCGPGEFGRGCDLDACVPEAWLSWAESFCESNGLIGDRAMFRAEAARCLAYWREESCGDVSAAEAIPMWLWKAWLRRRMAGSEERKCFATG